MKFRSAIVCLTAVLAGASLAGAATLNVGPTRTYTTLQSAVNAAVDGDTILVDPGTYLGKSATMYIDGKSNLLIKANGGPVILDQDGRANSVSGKGICNVVGSSTNVAFEGLTFVNAQVRDNDSGYNAAAIAWEVPACCGSAIALFMTARWPCACFSRRVRTCSLRTA